MPSSLRRFYRRLRYGQPIVVVSGLPRSGTSMVMKMLEAGGLPVLTDGLRTADEDNPMGYYEIERVKNLGQEHDKSWLAGARGKGIKVISFLLKSLPSRFNYRVVFIRREMEEVLASQRKMLARRGEAEATPPERMRALFDDDLWRAGYQLKRRPEFETLELHYSAVLARPLEEARRLAAFLGGGLDAKAMAAAVDPQLYRNRASRAGP
ncbi:MAG TPA: sulfotransferase family protein [Vicinamibacteria bacterium]|nr:sulfotransferase family protein [Vicinamibacteria bacterium]